MSKKVLYFVVLPLGGFVFCLMCSVVFFYNNYSIPTPAMESTILMGDQIFCKADEETKRGAVTVFIWPGDNKTHYIKRCIAIGGDIIQIKNRQVYLNGQATTNPSGLQYTYSLFATRRLREDFFRKYQIPNYGDYKKEPLEASLVIQSEYLNLPQKTIDKVISGVYYRIDVRPEVAAQIKKEEGVIEVIIEDLNPNSTYKQTLFPYINELKWSTDNYGPLWVPKQGSTITLDSLRIVMYGELISRYEGWSPEELKIEGRKLYLNGQLQTKYTFKQDYFFMMGDNRHNSFDSRYWGFVPKENIIGTASIIYFSVDPGPGFSNKIRWNRLFNPIE